MPYVPTPRPVPEIVLAQQRAEQEARARGQPEEALGPRRRAMSAGHRDWIAVLLGILGAAALFLLVSWFAGLL